MAREPFNDVWANAPTNPGNDASFIEPRAVIFDTGWEGGADKDAPKAGEQNWWQNRADNALQNLERYGVMTWDTDAIYSAGAPVRATDDNYYESLANANTGNDPVSTSAYWRLIGPSLYGVVPVGSIMAIAHNGVPDLGWLKCNGSVLLRASYARLFAKISTTWNSSGEATTQFRLPDLRGEFLRGFDDARGVDSGRAFASRQRATLVTYDDPGTNATVDTVRSTPSNASADTISQADYSGTSLSYSIAGFSAPALATGGGARPRNTAINYWIKY